MNSLELQCLAFLQAHFNQRQQPFDAEHIISVLDYTHLGENLDASGWEAFKTLAVSSKVAAVCVYPEALAHFDSVSIKKATVINFPQGDSPLNISLKQIEKCHSQTPVDEIDYVFDYNHYLHNDHKKPLHDIHEVQKQTAQMGLKLKVILETGAFKSLMMIHDLSLALIDIGVDFLKTSTGKIDVGATPEAAFMMLQAIKTRNANTGIKYSGGIREPNDAMSYIQLSEFMLNKKAHPSWLRIGASQLLTKLTQSSPHTKHLT